MSDLKKKNKLDLDYNKNCQFFNTTIIISVTVFIGILLAILTEQIKIGNNFPFIFTIFSATVTVIFLVYFLIKFHNRMKEIMENLDKLEI